MGFRIKFLKNLDKANNFVSLFIKKLTKKLKISNILTYNGNDSINV